MQVSRTREQPTEQVQATKRTEAAHLRTERTQQVKAQEKMQAKETVRKPVVNGQGQTVGTRLNVSA